MLGNYLETIQDAHPVRGGADGYDSLSVRVRNTIIVLVKTRIRRLANMHGSDVIGIERIVG